MICKQPKSVDVEKSGGDDKKVKSFHRVFKMYNVYKIYQRLMESK